MRVNSGVGRLRGAEAQRCVQLDNDMKVLATAYVVFIFAVGCGDNESTAFNFQSQVGVVDVSSSNDMCLIPNANLAEGNRVQIVCFGRSHEHTSYLF